MAGAEGSSESRSLRTLVPLLHEELRRLARACMKLERPHHTLQPTALVNEAYIRLVGNGRSQYRDRAEFLGIAARVMRQVLVDYARARAARKRDAGVLVSFDDAVYSARSRTSSASELLDLDRALKKLFTLDARQARVVELRCFGGLTIPEIAELVGVSTSTVDNDWRTARIWLRRELGAARLTQ